MRRLTIINKGYCLNCLAFDHSREWCSSRDRCQFEYGPNKICNAKHHTILHREERDPLSSSFEDEVPYPDYEEMADSLLPEALAAADLNPSKDKTNTANLPASVSFSQNTLPPTSSEGAKPLPVDTNEDNTSQTQPLTKPKTHQTVDRLVNSPAESNLTLTREEPILPPLVRVYLNYRGAKMFGNFIIDPRANESYILADVAKWLPDFKPKRNNLGQWYAKFVLEPAFPHKPGDEISMYLQI